MHHVRFLALGTRTHIPNYLRAQLLLRHWKLVVAFLLIAVPISVLHFAGQISGSPLTVVGTVERATVEASSEYHLPVVMLQIRLPDGALVGAAMPRSETVRIGSTVELRVYRHMLIYGPSYEFARYFDVAATTKPNSALQGTRDEAARP
jgi:hypothetical protein